MLIAPLLLVACGGGGGADDDCPAGEAAEAIRSVAPAGEPAIPVNANGRGTTWQWQLQGDINDTYDVDVYDVDLFDTCAATIADLQADGRIVVCYFSAGSSEDFRPDFDEFYSEDKGAGLGGFDRELWLDIRSQNVFEIMDTRLDMAVAKGCDGVEPDNMGGFTQDSCFDITEDNQLAYNRVIANLARSKGLSVGLKNDPDQVLDLVAYFDFSVSE